VQQIGSLFWVTPGGAGPGPVRSKGAVFPGLTDRYPDFFHYLRRQGIFLAPSPFEVGFLSAAHDESHIDQFAAVLTDRYGRADPVSAEHAN